MNAKRNGFNMYPGVKIFNDFNGVDAFIIIGAIILMIIFAVM